MHDPRANARLTGYTRAGFAERYHRYRPHPPAALVDLLLRLAGTPRPTLVVDVGCGTGLSTAVWATRADEVVGVEPLAEMRRVAESMNAPRHVRFVEGVGQETGLPDGVADVVTCSQSLHHMEPQGTLAEVARILRDAGVFAAYDYEWPPVVHREAEAAFFAFMRRMAEVGRAHGVTRAAERWDKPGHITSMRESGRFRYTREVALHNTEICTAQRWVGFALTIGLYAQVLDLGLDDDALGLTELRAAAARTLGDAGLPWHVSYRVCVAVK